MNRLSYYYNWTPVFGNPAAFRAVIREFLDNGANRFVINDKILYQADKYGLTIAVEKVFGLPDSVDEVIGLVTHFGRVRSSRTNVSFMDGYAEQIDRKKLSNAIYEMYHGRGDSGTTRSSTCFLDQAFQKINTPTPETFKYL